MIASCTRHLVTVVRSAVSTVEIDLVSFESHLGGIWYVVRACAYTACMSVHFYTHYRALAVPQPSAGAGELRARAHDLSGLSLKLTVRES